MKSKLRLDPADVLKIERNVVIVTDTVETKKRITRRSSATSPPSTEEPESRRYGHSRYDDLTADVPTLYLVPFKGEMGTDIHRDIYEKVVEDILIHEPDVVVFVLDSAEYADLMIRSESEGVFDIEEYRSGHLAQERACRLPPGAVDQGFGWSELDAGPRMG